MDYNNEESSDVMKAFFKGEVKNESPQPKLVELGDGRGIGHTQGSYKQYVKALGEQKTKGNGTISLGKSINTDKEIFLIQDPTDKFDAGDIPHVLVNYSNIMGDISLKVTWIDSMDDNILEQYYKIPSAYSMGSDWWDQYSVYFIGPEDMEEGEYKVEISAMEIISREQIGDKSNNIKTFRALLEFSVGDSSE